MLTLSNYINGTFQAPRTAKYISSINPATALEYAQLPDSGESDVNAAVSAATAAFETWSATSAQYRSEVMIKVRSDDENCRFDGGAD
jgi:aminomuconate-semialdehyde/2-hydroxymuconate-6-semialdehyde dehydrogenase